MIQLDLTSLHSIDTAHGLSKKELSSHAGRIPDYLKKIKERDQGFYSVIDDKTMVDEVLDFARDVRGKYEHLVVLGIGGSSLGTICLQQSLMHLFKNEGPSLHVLDNIDPSLIREVEDVIDLKKTLFIVVSKSGGTPETLAQYFYFRKRGGDFVFITDPEKGLLRKIAQDEGTPAFNIPPNVGGRFSVLTPVGLLPAALLGIDIRALLEGARAMRDLFLSENFEQNLPFQIAAIQHALNKKRKWLTVMMPYSQRLIRFADWYRQLLAESIGKKHNEKGGIVNVGLTPINALGVTDQHSQSQLYNEGPNDKLFIFIKVKHLGPKLAIPNPYPEDPIVSFLNNATFDQLMHTEQMGTLQSLTKNDRPAITLTIDQVNEANLGALFLFFEGATAFLGEFYGINAFDQPGVELSKTLTKKLLTP